MNKKKVLIIIGCIVVLLLVVGVSYAYWSLTFTQTDNNVVTTDCFQIEFMEGNAINLTKAYPVSDEDGLKNTPYTFTIKNVCDSSARYQINLETMNHNNKKLPDEYLKANIMESNVSKVTTKLESSLNTSTTIEEAVDAYKLLMGVLGPNETKEFQLRLWMHSDVTAMEQDSMNATYNGKISVITSYYQDNRGTLIARDYDLESWNISMDYFWQYSENISSIIFENELKEHEDAIDTFDVSESQDGSVMSYLVPVTDIGDSSYVLYIQSDGGVKANSNSSFLFYVFFNLENIEGLEHFDTSNVTNMLGMFGGCSSLTNLDFSSFNTSNVTDMMGMFAGCNSLTNLDFSSFNTSKVTDMSYMFDGCSSLISLDLSSFDTRNVTNMDRMFSYCNRLTSLDLSGFDTSNVINGDYIFGAMPKTSIVKVRNETTRDWVLKQNSNWSVDNVLVEA